MTGERFYNIGGKVVGLAVLAIILYVIYNSVFHKKNEGTDDKQNMSVADSVMQDLCSSHNAIFYTDLLRQTTKYDAPRMMLYSIDLDDVLDSSKGRPIGFILDLDDIRRVDSSIVGLFSTTSEGFMFPPQIFVSVELKMSKEDKDFVLSNTRDWYGHKFAIIANIDNFKRPNLIFDTPVNEEFVFESDIVLKSPGLMILQGDLIDIVYLGTQPEIDLQVAR